MKNLFLLVLMLLLASPVFAFDYYSNGRYNDFQRNNYRSNYSYQQQREQQEQMRRMQQEQANQEYYRRQRDMNNRYRQYNRKMF